MARKAKKLKTAQIGLRVPAEIRDRLEAIAAAERRSLNTTAQIALENYIDDYDERQQTKPYELPFKSAAERS